MINPGERRHYLTVEVEKRTPDGMGGSTTAWIPKYRVWASIWPVSAKERIEADKPHMTVSCKIRIPFIPDFKPQWRLTKNRRVFEVSAIINVQEMDEELDLLCKESTA